MSLMYNYGFECFINEYTRITNESQSCIDHIFLRFKNINLFTAGVFHVHITDHSIIALIMKIDISHNIIGPTVDLNKSIEKIDFEGLKSFLYNVNWNSVLNSNNVNIALDNFYKIVLYGINRNKQYKVVRQKLVMLR